ncbi:putative UPF0481 protein At3g02645 [Benincasa hispida]|uniref:putative UPF0481 protein At3g02645 n=1 Tax=Benincasa hispida TaxID=102211 RepID=UPI0019012963|nr:putative UPF0481 protein At3g02645 [Benincasa hispida]
MKALDVEEGKKNPTSIVRSKSGEKRWVIYINNIIEKELNNNQKSHISSSIFIVPKFLSATKPEDYTPQFLALGPYHHFSQELYDNMERYKLMNVSNKNLQFNFQSFLSRLSQFDLQIRASYHRRLDLDADTLALIMTIDGLFLLDFLYSKFKNYHDFLILRGKNILSNDDVVVRDIIKLENQIPLFVLKEIYFGMIQCEESNKLWDDLFDSVLVGFCSEISPLDGGGGGGDGGGFIDCAHVLDVLHRMILPEDLGCSDEAEAEMATAASRNNNNNNYYSNEFGNSRSSLKKDNYLWNLVVDSVNILRNFKKVFEFIGRLMEVLPVLGGLVSPMGEVSGEDGNRIEDKTPLMEAGVKVPTASELFDTGVRFKASTSIKTIKFDAETVTFFLPVIKISAHSEVILRNLVAYEAMAMPHSMVFTRYLHLMNNFIDTAEDVKILKHSKILLITDMIKKDEEIAMLFNGIMANNYSIGLSPAKELDQAINGVNKYYQKKPKVKANRIIKKYVYSSWRILTLIATLLILGLLVLQSFCSVYNCPRLFGTDKIEGDDNS